MSDLPRLVARVDAGPGVGAGHFMRCLALAEHWRDLGGKVTFAGTWPEDLGGMLAAEGIDGASADFDPEGAVAVLDGYDFDAAYHDRIAAVAAVTLVIDDVGHLPRYGGDVLLNANVGASAVAYPDAPAKRLLGPAYTLLRRGVRALRDREHAVSAEGKNVLLSLGGGDRVEDWRAILEALQAGTESATFHLLPGFAGSRRTEVERLAAAAGPRFRVAAPEEAVARMAEADLAVAAAGTTALELAFLGVPSVLVSVAANQRPTAGALAERGASVDLGDRSGVGAEALRSTVLRLLASPETRRSMRSRGREILDGRGVERVAEALREGVDFRPPRRPS